MNDDMIVISKDEKRNESIKCSFFGILTGLLVGVVFTGALTANIVSRERTAISELLACDPATNEQSLLKRNNAGKLSCEKSILIGGRTR